jgi:hypothetical protein
MIEEMNLQTARFTVIANDKTGVIDINGVSITEEFLSSIKNNNKGYVTILKNKIFYDRNLLKSFSRLLFDFRTVVWTIIMFGLILLMVTLTSCSLIGLSSEDANKYYKPDTTLIDQLDSVYADNDGYYDMYGTSDPIEENSDDTLKTKYYNLIISKEIIQHNLDSLLIVFNELENELSNNKIIDNVDSSKYIQYKNIIDRLKYKSDSLNNEIKNIDTTKIKNIINNNDNVGSKLLVGMLLVMIALIISLVYNFIKKNKNKK